MVNEEDCTLVLIGGTFIAILTAVLFGQLWVLAVSYERRGLDKEVVRHFFRKHFPLFLGVGLSLVNIISFPSWYRDRRQRKLYSMQVFLSLITPMFLTVSIFTVHHALSMMEKIGEETNIKMRAVRQKWRYLWNSYHFFYLMYGTILISDAISTFCERDDLSTINSGYCKVYTSLENGGGGVFGVFVMVIIVCSFLSSGLAFSLSLQGVLALITKGVTVYIFYKGENWRTAVTYWILYFIFDTAAVMLLLVAVIFLNMRGSVFYAAYELAKARKNAAIEEEPQETYTNNGLPIAYEATA